MDLKVGVIGLGYVGLPLAVAISKKYDCIGFDINQKRIETLRGGRDETLEVEDDELKSSTLKFTSTLGNIAHCNFFIVTVPTPIDQFKKPDLTPLQKSSEAISSILKKGDIVVYESTVFPGCTEEECVPILEKGSGLIYNKDFYCGYSPERINPGDKEHRVETILKVTSGSTEEVAAKIDKFYSTIITAGTHQASSIRVAEAAKVIENSQRDINIAFVNELSLIFERMGIDTREVLEAAGTKWNFLKFSPGLVGGHCIGVDPYYLTYKSESLGYKPQIILSGRQLNDNMGIHVAQQVVKLLSKANKNVNPKILILGFTFKENCPDVRNTKVIDIYNELLDYGLSPEVYDPNASALEIEEEYGIELSNVAEFSNYDAIIHAVSHYQFADLDWAELSEKVSVIYDVKGTLNRKHVTSRL